MDKKIIAKHIDSAIEKCSRKKFNEVIGKHGKFYQNIRETLMKITDNEDEYSTLRDDIWEFREETKNLNYERLILKGTNGTFYKNNGVEWSVGTSKEMDKFIDDTIDHTTDEGLLYTMHNHTTSCFQSLGDLKSQASCGEKYSVTIGYDGCMIVKNTSGGVVDRDVGFAYMDIGKKMLKEFKKDYSSKIKELQKQYPNFEHDNYKDYDVYKEEYRVMFNEYVSKHIRKYTNGLDKSIKKYKMPMEVYYIKKN